MNDDFLRLSAHRILGHNEKLIRDDFNKWLKKRIEEHDRKIKKNRHPSNLRSL